MHWSSSLFCLPLSLVACSSQQSAQKVKIVDVKVALIVSTNEQQHIRVSGTVGLRQETVLGFTTTGRVAQIYVNEGDHVGKGRLLALLDTTLVKAQLDAAIAEQARAGAELQRSKQLFAQGWVTKSRLDSSQTAYVAAATTTRARRFATDTARIWAPSAGVILARSAEPAQIVNAGMPVVTLGEEARGYVLRVSVADRDVSDLSIGQPATIRISSLKDTSLTGQVVEIGGQAEQSTGTFEVEIKLPKHDRLRSGQIGSAEILSQDQSQSAVILLPPTALFHLRAGEGFVYVLPSGSDVVTLRKVEVAEARDGGVRLVSGLEPGEWVVVSGGERLRDKQRVRARRQAG